MAEKEESILATDKWIAMLNELPFTSKVRITFFLVKFFYSEKRQDRSPPEIRIQKNQSWGQEDQVWSCPYTWFFQSLQST